MLLQALRATNKIIIIETGKGCESKNNISDVFPAFMFYASNPFRSFFSLYLYLHSFFRYNTQMCFYLYSKNMTESTVHGYCCPEKWIVRNIYGVAVLWLRKNLPNCFDSSSFPFHHFSPINETFSTLMSLSCSSYTTHHHTRKIKFAVEK